MNSVQQQNLQNTAGSYPTNNQQNLGVVQLPVQTPVSAQIPAPAQQNICYPPQYYYGTPATSMPGCQTGGSGVTINILNPVGNAAPGNIPQIPYCIPAQQPVFQPQQPPPPATTPLPEQKPAEEPKKTEAKKEEPKKEIVQLTDEYVKSLENYLNNPNADIRLLGAKELLSRFKEDKSRRNDQALTNLLNKALRDSSQNVRLIALSTLDSNVAEGDRLTYKILQDMQKSNAIYNQDSVTAAQIMLKKAGKKLNVESKDNSVSLEEIQSQTGQKLDVTAG
ncbi:MAG: hypothetical protein PHC34_11650 [Candidatus Gastranaerophilales bacterium]|nr:hypothetical protein [Candidatus Gastranaerophilales bacterium]